MTGTHERALIRSYFDGIGFERLHRIYGEDPCSGFRAMVRKGHSEVLGTVLSWLRAEQAIAGHTILDAGCGSGTVSIPLAAAGATVHAVDFSEKMIEAARERADRESISTDRLRFAVCDFMSVRGSYDTVLSIDVLARYSTAASTALLAHLTSLASSRLILTYTPKGLLDRLWLAIGNRYASRRKAAPLYTHREADIGTALGSLGWTVHREVRVAAGFRSYFCCLLECRRREAGLECAGDFPEVWY
jgi:magnesium-protoporphyrin O-methyltransferase